jgi:hypothetical protein
MKGLQDRGFFFCFVIICISFALNKLPDGSHTLSKHSYLKLNAHAEIGIQIYFGFEILTTMAMKSTIFSDVTPCDPLKVNRSFGGTCASIFSVEE